MFDGFQRVAIVAAGALALAVTAGSSSVAADPGERAPVVLTTNRIIRASLDRIAARSESWRRAIASLTGTGRHVVVATPDQVVVADRAGSPRTRPFNRAVLAEVAPVTPNGTDVRSVLVVVNVDLLDAWHQDRRAVRLEFELDLDTVLVHEIYGHAVPYLLAGRDDGRCADPAAGQRAEDACSIQRENVIRAELGLGPRTDYGLGGLLLARR